MKEMNIGIVGYKFMGKAHSSAWMKVPLFFDPPVMPVRKVVCGRHEGPLKEFAERWGWEDTETDWKKMVHRDDVDIVDVSVPQYLHYDVAMEAVKAGKHVFCEKPLALESKTGEGDVRGGREGRCQALSQSQLSALPGSPACKTADR